MMEAFDGLIYISSGDYELEFLNQRFMARLGGNAVGQKCYRALHNLDRVCPWCACDRVLAGETVHRETLSPQDNRWYVCTSTPIRHAGKLAKMTIIQDITERKLAEELTRRLAYHDQLTGLPSREQTFTPPYPPVLKPLDNRAFPWFTFPLTYSKIPL
jgi:hypothetical protein